MVSKTAKLRLVKTNKRKKNSVNELKTKMKNQSNLFRGKKRFKNSKIKIVKMNKRKKKSVNEFKTTSANQTIQKKI